MATENGSTNDSGDKGLKGLGGIFEGLGSLLEKVGELAEKGEQLRKSGEFQSRDGNLRGVYGFNVKFGAGDRGVEVEPFGNLRKDARTGKAEVTEVREPMIDIFDEQDHVLVLAEMPGIDEENLHLELSEDILTVSAEKGEKKYRKEILLPRPFPAEKMSHACRNGILQVTLDK
jgi:HSP20 family protein